MDTDYLSKHTCDYRERLIKALRDPQEASEYLEVAIEEYDKTQEIEVFLLALRTVVEAQGGISSLAKKSKLNRQNLYRALSNNGNPRLNTFTTILHCLGFRLSVKPI